MRRSIRKCMEDDLGIVRFSTIYQVLCILGRYLLRYLPTYLPRVAPLISLTGETGDTSSTGQYSPAYVECPSASFTDATL